MNITKASYSRKFNLGNYESMDVSAEADLAPDDSVLDVWTVLRDNAEFWFNDQKNKKPNPRQEQPPTTQSNQATKTTQSTEDRIRQAFPTNLEALLEFKQANRIVLIKPKNFLGSEIFADISAIVKDLKGAYVSAGRDSHWEVPV